jgi:hypothetical protein
MTNRRDFVKTLIAGTAGALFLPHTPSGWLVSAGRTNKTSRSPLCYPQPIDDPWAEVPKILARIKAPVFPQRDFKITDYGATANMLSESTEALRRSIEACHAAGGGRVVVPPGAFNLP